MNLSGREKELLKLIAAGEADAGIGEVLGISKKTVQSQVANMKQKNGATSRAQLVAMAIRAGFVDS